MNKLLTALSHLCRTLLGIVFIFSGFVKAVDPLGTVYKIEDYLKAFAGLPTVGSFFMDLLPLATVAALVMIAFEFVLGCCLLTNTYTRITRWLVLAFMLVMTPLTLYLALTNPVSDCGCFGDAIVLTNWQTFWKNVVLCLLLIPVLIVSKGNTQRHDRRGLSVYGMAVLIVALLLVGGFMAYNLTHLPVIDFRPYKLGNNIPELMEVPDDAPQDVYETTLLYEKDGQVKEFTLQDYPKGDSTWTFVDQKTVLVSKGYEAPIHDFTITTADFDDITYDVLEAERVTLIIMYQLTEADREKAEQVRQLYTECIERGEPCYILTGASSDEVEEYDQLLGLHEMADAVLDELAEEEDMATNMELCLYNPICTTDPVTLKTIVRANPGVIVLEQGTIVEKYRL